MNDNNDYNIIFSQIHPGESATLSDWEMTHSHLQLQGDLGKGQFGDVKLAYLKTMTCTRRVRNCGQDDQTGQLYVHVKCCCSKVSKR